MVRHLHTGFPRYGPRRAAQGNGTRSLTRLTGFWLISLAVSYQGNYVVSFSVWCGGGGAHREGVMLGQHSGSVVTGEVGG
jgi:hypothetical protein